MARKANILIDDNMRMLGSSELGLNEQRRNLNLNQVGFISSLSVRSSGTNPVHYATGNTEHGGISYRLEIRSDYYDPIGPSPVCLY